MTKQLSRIKKLKQPELVADNLLPSGHTLLNLACSNIPDGCIFKGKCAWLVGDSSSGKTFWSVTFLAEALRHPVFKDYRIIYDDVEKGLLFDIPKLFGDKLAKTIESPGPNGTCSRNIEDFYDHIDDAIQEAREHDKPFIYVLDSMDSLYSKSAEDKFAETKEARRKGNKVTGSYGDGKAKYNSQYLRGVINGLDDTDSILIIISQVRDNLGFGFAKNSISGGRSLKFYATVQIITSYTGAIKKKVRGKDREIGIHTKVQVKKNRQTGQNHEIDADIYYDYGIDDIGACIDYLVDEGWWDKSARSIVAKELDFKGTREKLIEKIETEGLITQVREIVGRCWEDIQEAMSLGRRSKYGSEEE